MELRAVCHLRNINCLAPDQTLALKSGLNVVFGDNGMGKRDPASCLVLVV